MVQAIKAQTAGRHRAVCEPEGRRRDRQARHARGGLGRDPHADRTAACAGHRHRGRTGAGAGAARAAGRWRTRSTRRIRRSRSTPAGTRSRKQVVGSSVGFPVAQLLRHAAAHRRRVARHPPPGRAEDAEELPGARPRRRIRRRTVRPPPSHDFKQQLLPILGQHVIDVVLTSHEFILRDSVNLFRDMVTGTVHGDPALARGLGDRLVPAGRGGRRARRAGRERAAAARGRARAGRGALLGAVLHRAVGRDPAHPRPRRLRRGGAHRLDGRAVHGAGRRGPDAGLDSRRAPRAS